jgi:thioredoxin 1
MADIVMLNGDTFQAEVLDASTPVVVDFTAVWCNPCKMLDPVVKQLAQDWGDKVKIGKLDVDENSDLAVKYGVMGVPTLMLFVNGEPVQRLSGYQPKDRILAKFSAHI